MSTTTSQLQALIDKRAEAKLDAELAAMDSFIAKATLLRHGRHLKGSDSWFDPPTLQVEGTEHKVDLEDLFDINSPVRALLKAHWLPVYIQLETELFLQEHEELVERVAELNDQVEDLDRNKKDKDY